MATHDVTPDSATHGLPVLFIVDADREARVATESALLRRFAPDYQVVTADSPEGGLEALERLAQGGEAVALVAADLRLPGMDGVEFLERARAPCTAVPSVPCSWRWTGAEPGFPSGRWTPCNGRPHWGGSTYGS